MAFQVAYPEQPPVSCVLAIVDIIRNDETSTKRAELFQHAWNVLGYGFGMVIGRPDTDDHPTVRAQPISVQQDFLEASKKLVRCIHDS